MNTFQNDFSTISSRDEVLTALIHLGYPGCNAEQKAAFIPNFEAAMAYEAALATGSRKEIAVSFRRTRAV